MQTATTLEMLRSTIAGLREDGGGSIALVPTMGALHEGHLTVIREAKARAAHVVAAIFVTPRPVGAHEDLDAYPRQLARDSQLLEAEGVALLFDKPVLSLLHAATHVLVCLFAFYLAGRLVAALAH